MLYPERIENTFFDGRRNIEIINGREFLFIYLSTDVSTNKVLL